MLRILLGTNPELKVSLVIGRKLNFHLHKRVMSEAPSTDILFNYRPCGRFCICRVKDTFLAALID